MEEKKQNTPVKIITGGKEYSIDIPYEGSLGILALGAVGLTAWRKKRAEVNAPTSNTKKDE